MAAEGAVIRRGHPLLKIDRKPLVLMYGRLPLYRQLRQGITDGPDVKQWQDDLGLPKTGRVDATQVVSAPATVRVTEAKVDVGERTGPGQGVLRVSGIRQLVHVDLDTDDQALARKGAGVTVKLPGGERIGGKITSVGTVAKSARSGQGQGQDSGETTVDVDITLNKTPRTKLDQAPVDVELESERHKDVLAVPVEALLALREGGFGVEVVEGSATRVVPVEVGVFGSGKVEISGTGLTEGMKVGVPAT
ncbi:multidrug efflux pump subunit AcrA (membrane-fusion protein) [Streptosporangium album]|uniref:Multidrug efflux pump subunit AcrA (Membrane-fusion protein) n=1 Tax=Streptosporangium album TaxID=47479 RepID=A0A7W7RVT1_9ACTN|nr:HlyD family efflux transporter periplasmic adaptor subunit [Streptosporangium album]MBB4938483.1 multidrug efflux pump subunit AcrA (membrane-fusion protein) [Streptosporangium album]